MVDVFKCLQSEYSKTKWPFFSLTKILNKFGESGRSELNKLAKEGKARKRLGINGYLIELIIENETTKNT